MFVVFQELFVVFADMGHRMKEREGTFTLSFSEKVGRFGVGGVGEGGFIRL